MSKLCRSGLILAALWALWPAPGGAQEFRSEIQGNVTDTSGLVVVGARLRLVNEATGAAAEQASGILGDYLFLRLPPGRYRLEVSMSGFKTWVRSPIELDIASRVRLDVRLEVGQIEERVTVTAPTPMVNTVDASIDQAVREREISALPINGRNAYALLALSADIQPGNPGNFSRTLPREIGLRSNFGISGTPQRTAEVLLDGVPNTTGKLIVYTPSPDVVQEFKVQSNFDAEYGYSLGGVVNAVTRSGTNELHGSLWEFLRNDALRANDFFANRAGQGKAAFRFNQFGAAAGGPILRNRTFYFGSYEGIRERRPSTDTATVPTDKQRRGDFSETFAANGRLIQVFNPFTTRSAATGFVRDLFPNNQAPASLIDPVGKAMSGFYPLPNVPGDPLTGANNFVKSGPAPENYDTFLARIDHQVTSAYRFFGRYTLARPLGLPFNAFGNEAHNGWIRKMVNQVLSVDNTYGFSPTLLFNLRFGFSRHGNQAGPERGFDLGRLNLNQPFTRQIRRRYFPRIDVSDAAQLGPPSGGQDIFDNSYSLHGNVSKVARAHNLKFGADLRFNQGNQYLAADAAGGFSFGRGFTQGPDPLRANVNAGHGVASLLLGTGSGAIDIQEPMSIGLFAAAFYIQDTWTLSPRLSLNLGLRYENYAPLDERFNRMVRGFAFDVPSPIEAQAQANYARAPLPQLPVLPVKGGLLFAGAGGQPRGLHDPTNDNFAPRLGLAWSIAPRTAFRAGGGISYDRYVEKIPRNVIRQYGYSERTQWVGSIDGVTPLNLVSNPFPNGLVEPAGASRGLLTALGNSILVFETRARVPFIENYQASLQHELLPSLLVESAYIGNVARSLLVERELNQYPDRYLELGSGLNRSVPNPFFGLIDSGSLAQRTTTVAQLLRPRPHFLGLDHREHIGRTWYHSLRLKVERRFAHGFSFLASYRVSKLMDQSAYLNANDAEPARVIGDTDSPQRLVVSGMWRLPFRDDKSLRGRLTGGWQLTWIATFNSGFPVGGFAGAVNTGRSARLDEPTIDRWFDTSVFAVQPPFTLRAISARLPDVRQDGVKNFDLSLIKETRLVESVRAEFRAEFFNAFNTPLFGAPAANVRAVTFGQVRNQPNSPREIQLGLKVLF